MLSYSNPRGHPPSPGTALIPKHRPISCVCTCPKETFLSSFFFFLVRLRRFFFFFFFFLLLGLSACSVAPPSSCSLSSSEPAMLFADVVSLMCRSSCKISDGTTSLFSRGCCSSTVVDDDEEEESSSRWYDLEGGGGGGILYILRVVLLSFVEGKYPRVSMNRFRGWVW